MKKTICCVLAASGIMLSSLAEACTRVVFHGENNNVMTARSMDWKSDVGTNLWILPSGVKRTGQAGPQSASWTAKYGSVVATGYDISTTDGVNEAGLNANLLWLVESEYPQTGKSKKPKLSISLWAQYVLDNFSTVDEAIKEEQYFDFLNQTIQSQSDVDVIIRYYNQRLNSRDVNILMNWFESNSTYPTEQTVKQILGI